jgi:hypothetical protein
MNNPFRSKSILAQLAVDGGKGKYPEFKGNVSSVDIRAHLCLLDSCARVLAGQRRKSLRLEEGRELIP